MKPAIYCGLILFGALHAHVLDLEPFPLDKEYLLERDYYNAFPNNHYEAFPTFSEWVVEREDRFDRFNDWVSDVFSQFGKDIVDVFDPWQNSEDQK